MVYYLGQLSTSYLNVLDEKEAENYDETHLVFDVHDGCVLDFQESTEALQMISLWAETRLLFE